jgi:hypothetical protein
MASKGARIPQSEIWFDDGNIILSAQSKLLFRVHKSMLAAKSPLFSEMITHPPENQQTIQECPVVLVNHEPEEMTWVLKAFYDWGTCVKLHSEIYLFDTFHY